MVVIDDIGKIIATINPDLYAEFTSANDKKAFLNLKKENFWKAVEKAKPKSPEDHKLIYDSSAETLEPIYFWIIDKAKEFFPGQGEIMKLVDNFASSPGGGHFSELMAKGTKMQEEAMKIMQTTGILIKSLINIIYDLKEFELRLNNYKQAKSNNKSEAQAGLLSLKSIWMDNVDVKRGRGSINMLAQDLNFVTIRDAFMVAESLEEVQKMDLNERVKRILEPRLLEFFKWRELSEKELIKRYEIERTYLKNQLSSLKLYTRWAKPYLKAATQLEQSTKDNPALVTAFNTIIIELTILAKKKVNLSNEIFSSKRLPNAFRNLKLKRDYYSCVLMDFTFRGIPQKVGQHYAFGGRVEVNFRAYALNEDELGRLMKKMEDSDVNEALKLVQGMTEESIKELQEDISYFLKQEDERAKEGEVKGDDVNPFMALFGLSEKKKAEGDKKKKEEEENKKPIKADSYIEMQVRSVAAATARSHCFDIWDIYKKAHGMASYPAPSMDPENFEAWPARRFFGI